MDLRLTCFAVNICGNTIAGIKHGLVSPYTDRCDRNSLIYTHSKPNAETTLTSTTQRVFDALDIKCIVIPFTGDCGQHYESVLDDRILWQHR